jgi:antitoxin VapB
MALNIKNPEVERLATEVAEMARETKTQAIRRALEDRKAKLEGYQLKPGQRRGIREALEKFIWPYIPPEVRGKKVTKEEREEILGYGPDGV